MEFPEKGNLMIVASSCPSLSHGHPTVPASITTLAVTRRMTANQRVLVPLHAQSRGHFGSLMATL